MIKQLEKFVRPEFKTANRVIAIGDIHGQFNLLQDMVENQINFNPESDILVFLGDYIDRGKSIEDEIKTLNYLIDLYNANPGKVLLLQGNHEQMAMEAITDPKSLTKMSLWQRNGSNLDSLCDNEFKKKLVKFCKALPLYIEDKWVFVHAGAHMNVLLENQSANTLIWERRNNQSGYYGKKLIVGHTVYRSIQKSDKVICIDTGAYKHGVLSAYDVRNDIEYSAKDERSEDKPTICLAWP